MEPRLACCVEQVEGNFPGQWDIASSVGTKKRVFVRKVVQDVINKAWWLAAQFSRCICHSSLELYFKTNLRVHRLSGAPADLAVAFLCDVHLLRG